MLQTIEKKAILSGLNEKTSPFKDSRTRKVFKNTANLSLNGFTYDAKHLDTFLDKSQYSHKSP